MSNYVVLTLLLPRRGSGSTCPHPLPDQSWDSRKSNKKCERVIGRDALPILSLLRSSRCSLGFLAASEPNMFEAGDAPRTMTGKLSTLSRPPNRLIRDTASSLPNPVSPTPSEPVALGDADARPMDWRRQWTLNCWKTKTTLCSFAARCCLNYVRLRVTETMFM